MQPWIIVHIKRSGTLGKAYGIKPRCYWEPFGNLRGTNQEEGGKRTKNPSHPTPTRKKKAHHEGMLSLPIGCRKFLFGKLLVTIVFVGYLPVIELISCQFSICFFVDLFVLAFCFCLTKRGHGKPPTPNPQSLLVQPR